MTEQMSRERTLNLALEYVMNDRNKDNGDPEDNFQHIANFWTPWLQGRYGIDFELTRTDVAIMSAMIKIARLIGNINKEDNWVDIAGYAACGAEAAESEKEPEIDQSLVKVDGHEW